MIYSLHLYNQLYEDTSGPMPPRPGTAKYCQVMNLTQMARDWRRSIRAIGGYWMGSFVISEEDAPWSQMRHIYNNYLGYRLVERTYGMVSWEGFLYEFRLVRNGREYRRTMEPDWFHNRVKVVYSYPMASDNEVGNLTYNPSASSFQDDGQDFGDWETTSGDAIYSIYVTNSDGTTAWAFLGAAFTTTNSDDSIYTYTDVERATAGWSGEVSGKTPSSYELRNHNLSGARQETSWSEDEDSSDQYGRVDCIVSLGGAVAESAETLRDRELAEFAWPRSRRMGSGVNGENGPATLEVSVAGYWATLNWRKRETSRVAAASDLIETLVDASEFVETGRIEDNALPVKIKCDPTAQGLGDLIEGIVVQGDVDGNVWRVGVYADRQLHYEEAPTLARYHERVDGTLVNLGGVPVLPTMVQAGELILDEGAPDLGAPVYTSETGLPPRPGEVSDWNDPRVGYIEEVEFESPDLLYYTLWEQEDSITALREQIARGTQ